MGTAARRSPSGLRAVADTVMTAGAAATVLGALHRVRNWGATPGERMMPLPGDALVPEPADAVTRAVEIRAPASEVWRWLVQIGQNRGGMYSYARLENAVGLDAHSADEIREEWQHLAVGDEVVLVPPGWGPFATGYALPVARIEPGEVIVLLQSPPRHPWHAVWTFAIDALDDTTCRLLSRSRTGRPASPPLRAAAALREPVDTVMIRRMLLGIKQRAERSWRTRPLGPAPTA